jgi:coenzyme F420-reducing hydrogenase beta subunit
VFSLLAEEIITQNGVVFGAAFSNDFREVHHIAVERIEDLDKLRGSKYLQSNIDNTYQQAKKFLLAGKKVLFSGTPCQIEGLKAYLKKPYENLICVDIICHGVPSPKVWDRYVSYRETRSGAPTEKVYFRHKSSGWKDFSIYFEHKNGAIYEKVFNKDYLHWSPCWNTGNGVLFRKCDYSKWNQQLWT